MDRENLMHDYRDAEEVIKISDIMEQYPQQIDKMIQCTSVNNGNMNTGGLIKNEVNLFRI